MSLDCILNEILKQANDKIKSINQKKDQIIEKIYFENDKNISLLTNSLNNNFENSISFFKKKETSKNNQENILTILKKKKKLLNILYNDLLNDLLNLSEEKKCILYNKMHSLASNLLKTKNINHKPPLTKIHKNTKEEKYEGFYFECKEKSTILDFTLPTILNIIWKNNLQYISSTLFS